MASKQILPPTLRTVSGLDVREPNQNSATTRARATERRLVAVEVRTTNGRQLQYGIASGPINGGSMVNGSSIRRY